MKTKSMTQPIILTNSLEEYQSYTGLGKLKTKKASQN
jgi:hypothetical protein